MSLPEHNKAQVRMAARLLLSALGEDPEREGLKDTPDRVARLYSDVLDGQFAKPKESTAFKEEVYGNIVMVHHVPFYAFCEHHLLPFQGAVAVGYVPKVKLVGISKLVRMFRYWCKRITIQERLTNQALQSVIEATECAGAIVHVDAEHMCMTLRGVKSPGSSTSTIAYSGVFETDSELRARFMEIATK